MAMILSKRFRRAALAVALVGSSALVANPPWDHETNPRVQFCGLGAAYLNPKGALCLRVKNGQLFWRDTLIAEANQLDYVRGALVATKLNHIAVFPGPNEKFGDVFRIATALGTLKVERVFLTPPVGDEEFERKTKDAR